MADDDIIAYGIRPEVSPEIAAFIARVPASTEWRVFRVSDDSPVLPEDLKDYRYTPSCPSGRGSK